MQCSVGASAMLDSEDDECKTEISHAEIDLVDIFGTEIMQEVDAERNIRSVSSNWLCLFYFVYYYY